MKVTHLLTSGIGGAAQAAIRLNEALTSEGIDSRCVSVARRRQRHTVNVRQQEISRLSQVASSALTILQSKIVQNSTNLVSPLSLDLLNWNDSVIVQADVLHLHAFYNLASIKNFLTYLPNKTKVVTFHDERFFTGGCHFGCMNITNECIKCPQVHLPYRTLVHSIQKKTTSMVESNSKINFVAPSKWIMNRSQLAFPNYPKSKFFNVYNPIPSVAIDKMPFRTKQQLVELGFISQNLNNPIKNLNLLLQSFQDLQSRYPNRYKLNLIGESNVDYSHISGISQYKVQNYKELQEVLAKIDLLVVPSTHDNLPNVLGEALMNGVSIIGSAVGGIPEICKIFNMPIIQPDSPRDLIEAILNFRRPDRYELHLKAVDVFGYKSIANQMVHIYKSQTI